nr:hypothetical protein [Tanacetum cinerariifolium]
MPTGIPIYYRPPRYMETLATKEYPSLIYTFFLTHTVGGVFLNPEDKTLYDEMLRLQGLGSNIPTGVPYTEDEIMAIVRGGKQRGHILGVGRMSTDVVRGHGGDGGDDDRPPPYQVPTGCGSCLGNRGKGTRKPNLGGRRAGRLHTRQETRNLGLKALTDKSGPVPIRFEVDDRETLMPLIDHAAHWANYLVELVRELPLSYNLERIRRGRPSYISKADWDAQLAF